MSLTNSVSSYSTLSTRSGVSGLVSGLETEDLVEQMTTSTRNKIATAIQNQQLTSWKQDDYRSVTTLLSDFQDTYFSTTNSSNNIASSKFFDVASIGNTSSYVNISGTASQAESFVIQDIQQLAQTAKYTSSNQITDQNITTGVISDSWDASVVSGKSLSLTYGSSTVALTISSSFTFSDTATTDALKLEEIVAHLNSKIAANSTLTTDGTSLVSFGLTDGVITLTATDSSVSLAITSSSEELLTGLGFSADISGTGSITGSAADASSLHEIKNLADSLSGTTLTVTLNNISKDITFDAADSESYDTVDELKTYLQTKLDNAYGSGKVTITNTDGVFSFATSDNTSVFSIDSSDSTDTLSVNGALHLAPNSSNRINWAQSLDSIAGNFGLEPTKNADDEYVYELMINDITFTFEGTDTLSSVLSTINKSDAGVKITYSTTADCLTVTANESGVQGNIDIQDTANSNFATVLFGSARTPQIVGQDAIVAVSFDGGATTQTLTRSSNSFTVDGLSLEILGKADGDAAENISFTIENNKEELVEKITSFIEKYNAIITLTNGLITQERDRDYLPLTDEQEEEMSESEIEDWTKQARSGMLYGDSTLRTLISDLRGCMNFSVEGCSTMLYKIGISTEDYESNGILAIDTDKLTAALTSNFDEVVKLFTTESTTGDTEKDKINNSGISLKLNNILSKYASTTGADGLLVSLAGVKGDSTENSNAMDDKIDSFEDLLEKLRDKLENEENRLWNQFSALETALSKLNSMSGFFSNTTGATS